MGKKLFPCPFCGGSDIYVEPDERGSGGQWVFPIHVGCKTCAVNMTCHEADSVDEAANAWNRRDALASHTSALAERDAEIADLKQSVIAFCGPWAAAYAKEWGLPEGHLHPTNFDLLEKCGARMDDFTRAALAKDQADA